LLCGESPFYDTLAHSPKDIMDRIQTITWSRNKISDKNAVDFIEKILVRNTNGIRLNLDGMINHS